jgi:hypothetical protein
MSIAMTDTTIDLIPDPTRLIEGLRDTGYEFDTAIADIVDNSIAANAAHVDIVIEQDIRGAIRVSIADDGDGMNPDELRGAMRYGARERPNPASLGKYGLGLKTASTAFCRRLSVTSRASGTEPAAMMTWDLDHVVKKGKWEVIVAGSPDPVAVAHLDRVSPGKSGTAVVWTKVDRLMRDYATPDGKVARKALDRRIGRLSDHLALVYQRFLDTSDRRAKTVSITVNGKPVDAFDPFMRGISELVAEKDEFQVELSDGRKAAFTIRAYVLPRREEMAPGDLTKSRLSTETQGIYIYREQRLIHDADWLGMFQAEPHLSLLRVEFSFDHRLDDAFQLDIKKSQIILIEDLWKWVRDEFLPAPRNEANRRYREGERKKVAGAAKGAHTSSNASIASKEAIAADGVTVDVIDASKGEVELTNALGTIRLKLPVVGALVPGEVFVQPVPEIVNGLLFEPAIIERHKAVRINTGHPYYAKVYAPNLNRSVTVQGLDSLLWALCIAELKTTNEATIEHFRDMRYEVSKILRTLVENLPEPELDARPE